MSNTLAKKIFAVGLAASTVVMGLPLVAQAAPHAAGTNVMSSDGTVWMVMPDNTRRAYTSAGAFLSYGFNSWSTVVQANADDLALPAGSFIPPQDGSIACSDRGADKGTCYLITGGQKAGFTSSAVFTGRGFSFSNAEWADLSWMGSYSALINNTTDANLPGVLVNNNGTVQLVGTTGLLGIPDLTTFNGWGYSFSKVVPANAADKVKTQTGVMAARTPGQLSPTATTGGTTPPPVGGGLSVGLAGNNPAAAVIADGTANNVVLRVNLSAGSAPVSVTGIKFTKTGYTANTNVTGAGVYVNSNRHGNVISTLGADGVAVMTFSNEPIVVPAGSSVVVEFRVNIGTDANSGTIGFNVNSAADITSNASSVSGSFPVMGNTFTTVDGVNSLAAVRIDVQSVNPTGVPYNVNATDAQRITKFRVVESTSNEKVKIHSLTLWNNGTAADGDIKDVELRDQTGVVLATAQQVGKEVVFNLATPYELDKGQTKDFEVWAKIVNGAARTVQFTVYNDYDLYITGSNTLSGILPTASLNSVDTTFPVGDTTSSYNTVTIGSGSLTMSRSADSPSSALAPGTTDVILAKYDLKATGEDMEVRGLSFGITTGASSDYLLSGTVYVKIDGNVVFSAASNTTNFPGAGTDTSRTLSSYYILKAGQTHVLTVEGSVNSSATSDDTYLVNDMSIDSVKRLVTNDIVDPSTTDTDGHTRSVTGGALTVTTLTTPVAASLVAPQVGVEFARFQFNAQASGEDIRVSAFTVTDTVTLQTVATTSNLSNMRIYDVNGNQILTSSNPTFTVTGATTATIAFNLTNPIIVSRTTPFVVVFKADLVSGGAQGSHTFKIANTASHVTSTGKDTGNSTGSLTISGSGQAMTLQSGGTLTGSLVTGANATPSQTQLISVGTEDATFLAVKFTAQNEAMKLTTLILRATGTALNSNAIRNIEVFRQVGSGTVEATPFLTAPEFASCSSNACSKTFTASDNLLADPIQPGAPVTLYFKGDIGSEGQAKLKDDFRLLLNMDGTDVIAKGVTSAAAPSYAGGQLNGGGTQTHIVPFKVTVSGEYPSSGSTQQSSVSANTTVGRFKITNNGNAKVTMTYFGITDSGSNSATVNDRYDLSYSSEASSDYFQAQASTTVTNLADNSVGLGTSFTINGGSYRYLTVRITAPAGTVTGDSWTLGVASLGDVKFSVTEADLGYDANQDGDLSDTITAVYTDGKPTNGTVEKQ